jgi:hypothetical protein
MLSTPKIHHDWMHKTINRALESQKTIRQSTREKWPNGDKSRMGRNGVDQGFQAYRKQKVLGWKTQTALLRPECKVYAAQAIQFWPSFLRHIRS